MSHSPLAREAMVHHLVKIERRLLSHHEEFSRILTRCRWARQSPEDDLLFEVLGERFQGFHRTAKQWAAGIQIIPLGLRPVWTENGNEGRERGGEDCDIVVSVSDDRGRGGTSTWRRNDESDDQQLTQDTNLENLNNDEIAATSHVRRALEGTEFWALILNYILKIKAERSHFWDLRDFKVKAEQRRRYWEHERIKRERWSREDTKLRVNNPRSVLVWLKAERSKVETPRIAWKDVLLRTQYSHYIQTGVDYGDEDTEDEDEGVRKANMEERKGNEEERKGNEGVYEWNVDRRDYWAVVLGEDRGLRSLGTGPAVEEQRADRDRDREPGRSGAGRAKRSHSVGERRSWVVGSKGNKRRRIENVALYAP